MIDPRDLTNKNLFTFDYCGEERRASLVKLQRQLDQSDAYEHRRNNLLIAALRFVRGSVRLNQFKTAFQSRKAEVGAKEDQ